MVTLAALPEELGSIPSTQTVAHKHLLSPAPEDMMPSSDLHNTVLICIHRDTCTHTHNLKRIQINHIFKKACVMVKKKKQLQQKN